MYPKWLSVILNSAVIHTAMTSPQSLVCRKSVKRKRQVFLSRSGFVRRALYLECNKNNIKIDLRSVVAKACTSPVKGKGIPVTGRGDP